MVLTVVDYSEEMEEEADASGYALVTAVIMEDLTLLFKISLTYLMSPITLTGNGGTRYALLKKQEEGPRKTPYEPIFFPIINGVTSVQSSL